MAKEEVVVVVVLTSLVAGFLNLGRSRSKFICVALFEWGSLQHIFGLLLSVVLLEGIARSLDGGHE